MDLPAPSLPCSPASQQWEGRTGSTRDPLPRHPGCVLFPFNTSLQVTRFGRTSRSRSVNVILVEMPCRSAAQSPPGQLIHLCDLKQSPFTPASTSCVPGTPGTVLHDLIPTALGINIVVISVLQRKKLRHQGVTALAQVPTCASSRAGEGWERHCQIPGQSAQLRWL